MRKRPVTVVSTFAFAAGLAMSACGGGGGSDHGSASSSLTKAEFIKQADAICKKYNDQGAKRAETLFADVGDKPDYDKVGKQFVDELIPIVRKEISELQALDKPKADYDKLNKMLDDLDQATDDFVGKLKDDPEALFTSDSSEDDPYADVNKTANDYGFKECGSEG